MSPPGMSWLSNEFRHRARGAAVLALAVIAVLALATSCGKSACSSAGGQGGFEVYLAVPSYHRSPDDVIMVCAAGECDSVGASADKLYIASTALSDDDTLADGSALEVTAELIDSAGARIAGGTTSVEPVTFYPNGPKCSPRVLGASLVIDENGVHQAPADAAKSSQRTQGS